MATSRAVPAPRPRSRHATTKLAARRFTSHSHGAGSVSSRSLMEKITRRSGVANPPKLDKCASPQHWTRTPVDGVAARSAAIVRAAPAVERERGADHAAMAQGEQVAQATLFRRQDEFDRVATAGRRLPVGVRLPGAGGPQRLACRVLLRPRGRLVRDIGWPRSGRTAPLRDIRGLLRRGFARHRSPPDRVSGQVRSAGTAAGNSVRRGGPRQMPLACCRAYLAASIFFAASAPALAASAFSPSPIGFRSSLILRIVPVNLLSYAL